MDLMTLAMTSKIMGGGGSSGGDASFDDYFAGNEVHLTLPTATKIRDYGCYRASKLKSVNMPNVTSIGSNAFYYSGITTFTAPKLKTISTDAFKQCTSLVLTSLPSGITKLTGEVFNGCYNLAISSLPSGLTEIPSYAFYECRAIKTLTIPSGVTKFGAFAFGACTGLETVTFEGTPTTMYTNNFSSCTNLTTINVPWAEGAVANAPWGATNATINYNYKG